MSLFPNLKGPSAGCGLRSRSSSTRRGIPQVYYVCITGVFSLKYIMYRIAHALIYHYCYLMIMATLGNG